MSYDSSFIQNSISMVGINPEGGYVTSWKVRKGEEWQDVLYMGSALKRSGIPVLFPYFGKATTWPQHGFGRNCRWSVIEESGSRVVMQLRSDELSPEVKEWYPYTFLAQISVEVGESGELLYSLEVENVGEEVMPISPGLHPYWALKHSEKQGMWIEGVDEFDATSFDWENAPPDNRYDFSGRAVLHLPDKQIVIEDISEKPVVKHVVVWSLTPVRDPDFDFVCVEPIVGYNYAIDREPVLVAPGECWGMKIRFSVLA